MIKRLPGLLLLVCGLAFGQPPAPAFEVATIKPSHEGEGHSSWHSRPGYLVMKNLSFKVLTGVAYSLPADRVLGGPKWTESDRFDIEARAIGPAGDPELLRMLQSLLADRFHLAIHRETKTAAGYALVLAKDALKIRPDEGEGGSSSNGSRGKWIAKRVSMDKLATFLNRTLGMPVVNSTDLQGAFTFTLEWAPEPTRSVESPDKLLPDAPTGPSLFTALQTTLGLKLESRKVPIEVLVIDKAEKPAEN
ncbi:MAG TPA: TIGR03435 family protein [Bryobacteraceae bacterium]|jgi:uncharacterized protein (TIGR03435 family)|nr:TIGR03435 family protein [Bryobacteraceae bacterium]